MPRWCLILTLLTLVAMPRGLCICHYLEGSAVADCLNDAEKGDDSEDQDSNCSCKLEQDLAPSSSEAQISFNTTIFAISPSNNAWEYRPEIVDPVRTQFYISAFEPAAQILCALRI